MSFVAQKPVGRLDEVDGDVPPALVPVPLHAQLKVADQSGKGEDRIREWSGEGKDQSLTGTGPGTHWHPTWWAIAGLGQVQPRTALRGRGGKTADQPPLGEGTH